MKKHCLLLVLMFFIFVLLSGCVSAGHTYKKGGYSFTVSDKTYDNIQRLKNGDKSVSDYLGEEIKTKYYKTVKKPIYKKKTVYKLKWKYKKVKVYWSDSIFGNDKIYKVPKKYKSWKFVGETDKTTNHGRYFHGYYVFKKLVSYKVKEEVCVGYKKVKLRVYAEVGSTSYNPYVTFRVMGKDYSEPINNCKYYWL